MDTLDFDGGNRFWGFGFSSKNVNFPGKFRFFRENKRNPDGECQEKEGMR